MNKNLEPVLHCVQCIATVIETGSFTGAAQRLRVQQSAVSHRVKGLEKTLGYELFQRTTRRLEPTAAGRELARASSDAILAIESALDRIEASRRNTEIRLSIPSSIAMKWLIPRLGEAQKADLRISIHAQDEVVDLAAGEADVAVRFGRMPGSDLHATKLCDCWVRPVANPAYIATCDKLPSRQILADRRGESDETDFNWEYWSSNAAEQYDLSNPVYFDRADLMLQAAIAGAGVALGRSLLVESDIEAGFLTFAGDEVLLESAYWLVTTYQFAKSPAFKRLSRWITRQAKFT